MAWSTKPPGQLPIHHINKTSFGMFQNNLELNYLYLLSVDIKQIAIPALAPVNNENKAKVRCTIIFRKNRSWMNYKRSYHKFWICVQRATIPYKTIENEIVILIVDIVTLKIDVIHIWIMIHLNTFLIKYTCDLYQMIKSLNRS